MTKQEAVARLIELRHQDDREFAHVRADRVLCELLAELGYGEVVTAWQQIEKWYA